MPGETFRDDEVHIDDVNEITLDGPIVELHRQWFAREQPSGWAATAGDVTIRAHNETHARQLAAAMNLGDTGFTLTVGSRLYRFGRRVLARLVSWWMRPRKTVHHKT